ncbi:MAG: heparan-alpha-glucosaminide N-acetyltransferase domain-containing protein [Myxococcota bacterium]
MPRERFIAIDWLRGFVMILMAIDHASGFMNTGRLAVDSVYPVAAFFVPGWEAGTSLDGAQFFTRWITHLCAPTFLFLSGTSLAMSVAGRTVRGESARSIDRHLVARGLVLIAFEACWLSLGPSAAVGRYLLVLQVLFAIGASLVAMAALRRLPSAWLVGFALAWFVVSDVLTPRLAPVGPDVGPVAALLLAPGEFGLAAVAYPVLPWLAMMMLGWAFGTHLMRRRERGETSDAVAPHCAFAGVASLLVFTAVRGSNGIGNLGLLRDDGSWVQWLHTSKYPPSLSFACLELGLMALLLAALLFVQGRMRGEPWKYNPCLVLGRTALFFYLLHFPLLLAMAIATGSLQAGGLVHTYLAALAAVVLLYPACLAYHRYKSRHPDGWTRFV